MPRFHIKSGFLAPVEKWKHLERPGSHSLLATGARLKRHHLLSAARGLLAGSGRRIEFVTLIPVTDLNPAHERSHLAISRKPLFASFCPQTSGGLPPLRALGSLWPCQLSLAGVLLLEASTGPSGTQRLLCLSLASSARAQNAPHLCVPFLLPFASGR